MNWYGEKNIHKIPLLKLQKTNQSCYNATQTNNNVQKEEIIHIAEFCQDEGLALTINDNGTARIQGLFDVNPELRTIQNVLTKQIAKYDDLISHLVGLFS